MNGYLLAIKCKTETYVLEIFEPSVYWAKRTIIIVYCTIKFHDYRISHDNGDYGKTNAEKLLGNEGDIWVVYVKLFRL